MFTNTKHIFLGSLFAALSTSVAAQTTEHLVPSEQTTDPAVSAEPIDPTNPGAAMTETMPVPEASATSVEGQIVLQSETSILADDLIGSRVYSAAGETVGDINDLIVNLDGTIEGVVIGVGGFLGMGEKDVAVEMAAITIAADPETNAVRFLLSATREDLDAAPEFKTASEQKAEQAIQRLQQSETGAVAPVAPADATTVSN